MNYFLSFILVFLSSGIRDVPPSFKEGQLRYQRVRTAYAEKEPSAKSLLKSKSIDIQNLELYIRAFKHEKVIELWGKNKMDTAFQLVKEYKVCQTSGTPGPKRQQGDLQIPEGYYHINVFNPASNYYLSLGVNYPNRSDRILGNKNKLGGDIFIHGACVTIGCLPITDDEIKELYLFCVEAKNNGQRNIPVTIFPARFNHLNYLRLKSKPNLDKGVSGLWDDLKKGYDYFNTKHTLPSVKFLESGRHQISR